MSRVHLFILALAISVPALAAAELAERNIASYPFVASAERAASIRNSYKKIVLGMSPAEVASILGEPDEIHTLFEPQIKNAKAIGYTQWYVIRRLVRHGSTEQKQESLVRVSFGSDSRVSKVDAWGL